MRQSCRFAVAICGRGTAQPDPLSDGKGTLKWRRKNVLLIEPRYPNKYPPLGLMKLAAHHGPRGRGDRVTFIKGERPEVLSYAWDRVYVTTLFSFEWNRTADAIDFAVQAARGQQELVFVGGIAPL